MPSVCMCMCEYVCLSHFYIKVYISLIFENIFSRFAENVYGCENRSVKSLVLT